MSKQDDFAELSPDQKHHLFSYGIGDLKSFVTLREWQLKNLHHDLKSGLTIGLAEPCWACREIARKLGVLQHELEEAENVDKEISD